MNEPLTRRTFARELTVGAAVAATTVAPASVQADEPKSPTPADQLLAMLQARFPNRLNDEQWKEVRGKLEGQVKASQTLSEFKLQNSDGPATVFAAYRRS